MRNCGLFQRPIRSLLSANASVSEAVLRMSNLPVLTKGHFGRQERAVKRGAYCADEGGQKLRCILGISEA